MKCRILLRLWDNRKFAYRAVFFRWVFHMHSCRSLCFIHCYWLVCVCEFLSSLLRFDRFPLSECRQFLRLVNKCGRSIFSEFSRKLRAERLPARTWLDSFTVWSWEKTRRAHKKLDHLKTSSFSAHIVGMTILLSMWWRSTICFCALTTVHCRTDQGYFSQFSVNFALMIKTFCVTRSYLEAVQ